MLTLNSVFFFLGGGGVGVGVGEGVDSKVHHRPACCEEDHLKLDAGSSPESGLNSVGMNKGGWVVKIGHATSRLYRILRG
jgi:hypothetical protein